MAAAVAMHDHVIRLPASPQRHVQGIANQVGRHAFVHGPADHHPRIQIDDHCQIQPAFLRMQVGDVTHPFLIWRRCLEILLEQVLCHWQGVLRIGRGLELLGGLGTQSLPLHRGGYRLAIAG